MTERTQIILSLGDAELLIWWRLFAYCPHPRLEGRMMALLHQTQRTEWIARGGDDLRGAKRPSDQPIAKVA